jgi:hypothetical protein
MAHIGARGEQTLEDNSLLDLPFYILMSSRQPVLPATRRKRGHRRCHVHQYIESGRVVADGLHCRRVGKVGDDRLTPDGAPLPVADEAGNVKSAVDERCRKM